MPSGEERTICAWGRANRADGVAIYAEKKGYHRIHKLNDAVAFSEDALAWMERKVGADGPVFIHMPDLQENPVHEYRVRAFSERVPEEVIQGAYDRGQDNCAQFFAPVDRCVEWYRQDAGARVLVPVTEPPPEPSSVGAGGRWDE